MIGTGAAIWGAGCLSLEKAGPLDFVLLNFTADTQQVEVTITDEDGNTALEETYEIEKRRDRVGVIREDGFTEATNGDSFDIVTSLSDREPDEWEFQVTCNESEMGDDVFYAEIREGHQDHIDLEFSQSTCSSGL